MKTLSIRSGGVALHTEEAGNPAGKPILFIHGFSQCGLAWRKQMCSDLGRDFRLVTMDIRGHGLSDKPIDAYGMPELWAQDVEALIDTLHLDAPILVASSYAGVIVSDYIRIYGEGRIGGVQLVGAVSRLGAPLVGGNFLGSEFLALMPGFFSTDAVESVSTLARFLRLCVQVEPSREDLCLSLGYNTLVPPHVRQALFARHVDNDAVFAAMHKPVSLVYGEADQIVSPRMCTHLEGLVPHADASTYPEIGHLPFWEAPERFNRELRAFRERA